MESSSFHYISDRFGVLGTGSIARTEGNASVGLRKALEEMGAGVELNELIEDFHAANGANSPQLPRFGYTSAVRSGVRAAAHPVIDGSDQSMTHLTRIEIEAGGVAYIEWMDVEDFSLSLALGESNDPDGLDVGAIMFSYGQGQDLTAYVTVDVPADDVRFDGASDRVLLVLAHANPDGARAAITYSAAWDGETPPPDPDGKGSAV